MNILVTNTDQSEINRIVNEVKEKSLYFDYSKFSSETLKNHLESNNITFSENVDDDFLNKLLEALRACKEEVGDLNEAKIGAVTEDSRLVIPREFIDNNLFGNNTRLELRSFSDDIDYQQKLLENLHKPLVATIRNGVSCSVVAWYVCIVNGERSILEIKLSNKNTASTTKKPSENAFQAYINLLKFSSGEKLFSFRVDPRVVSERPVDYSFNPDISELNPNKLLKKYYEKLPGEKIFDRVTASKRDRFIAKLKETGVDKKDLTFDTFRNEILSFQKVPFTKDEIRADLSMLGIGLSNILAELNWGNELKRIYHEDLTILLNLSSQNEGIYLSDRVTFVVPT